MKAALTDLDNPLAPPGSSKVEISADAFVAWMQKLRYTTGHSNPNQIVYFISKASDITAGSKTYTPNWHLTAMLQHRSGGDVRNFHFKVEMAKAASHYWHYVIHDHAGEFVWVGDPNPHIPATNQGGGGAGSDPRVLAGNLQKTEAAARSHGIDGRVTKRTQAYMMRVLKGMIGGGDLAYGGGHITTH